MRLLFTFLLLALAAPAFAVGTSHWVQTSEADFKNGTMQNVVATNLGDLKLSRAIKTILEQDPKVSSVYALIEAPDGTVYAGTGPQGVVLKLKDDKVSQAVKLDDGTSVFSLAIDGDGLLIGTGGEHGKILRLDKAGKVKELFSGEGVQYIWCMVRTPDGNIYAGTGPDGQLFEVHPDGKYDMVLDTDENNLLCMTSDGKDLLYIGTDPNGLVYRFNRKTKDVYVMLDAPESEISALALDKDHNLYAATAEAMPQQNQQEPAGSTEQVGRPEESNSGAPIPSAPPHPEPKPPKIPDPNPGEPDPIPKKLDIIPAHPFAKPAHHDLDDVGGLPGPTTSVAPTVSAPPTPPAANQAGQPREGGNAIYKIDPEGLVTEIFRQPVLVLSMIEQNGMLLAGTGSDGLIYQIDPKAQETIVLAKVEPKQVMSLLRTSAGRILLGLANTGGISSMTTGYASSGSFTSNVLDASQISRFGQIHLHGSLPHNTSLKISTRSGNVAEPSATGWSAWSEPRSVEEFMPVSAPAARFLQYRFSFATRESARTPIVDDVDITYQEPNAAPVIASIKIAVASKTGDNAPPPTPPPPHGPGNLPPDSHVRTITWDASDPNNDELVYTLYFRAGPQSPWILLKDKLKDPTYDWDTRSVADGRYEIKVAASDALANAVGSGRVTSRVSDPVQVDNTPPTIGDLTTSTGADSVRIQADAFDRAGTLAAFAYCVDSSNDWQTVLPVDKIADSPEEKLDFAVEHLKPGPHRIAVRATDAYGNQTVQTVAVNVDSPSTRP